MIGSLEEAATIAQFGIQHNEDWETLAPEGWEFLGEGAYRCAFRSPSGVVYKIENEDGEYEGHNCREFENIKRLKQIPVQGWRVPEATIYCIDGQNVIAMEFIAGGDDDILCQKSFEYQSYNKFLGRKYSCTCGKPNGRCVGEIWGDILEAWGIADVHKGNIRIEENGTRVLIDVADSY